MNIKTEDIQKIEIGDFYSVCETSGCTGEKYPANYRHCPYCGCIITTNVIDINILMKPIINFKNIKINIVNIYKEN